MQLAVGSTHSAKPPISSASAMITPSAPPSGIVNSASIAYERPYTRGIMPEAMFCTSP